MRILHIVNRLSDRGNGIVNLAVDVAIDQQRAGHTVAFLADQGGHIPLVESVGIRLFVINQDRTARNVLLAFRRFRRVIREFRPDVAFLDIGLPVMDGYELVRRMRERPGLETTVFVALTGYGQPSDRKISRAAGFHEHLVKPVQVSALLDLLDDPRRDRAT